MGGAVFTVEEVADFLKCHPDTIRRAIRRKEIKVLRPVPGLQRISASELKRLGIEVGNHASK